MNELYLPRMADKLVRKSLKSAPVVVVTGARQTGKSTLVRQLGPRWTYLTLDDVETLDRAQREPDALLRPEHLIIDEVQRSPDLLLAIKRAVDARRTPGRFLLTGSANLLLMQRVAETLAGRVHHLSLWPLTRREQLGLGAAGLWSRLFSAPASTWPALLAASKPASEDWVALARRGGYPTPAHAMTSVEERRLWFAGYTQTYLERDLRDLSAVASLADFRRLMRAVCLRIGNLVNQTEVGRDCGIPQPTVNRHLSLMETSYQLLRVPAYSVNRTKRLIKAPKLYWSDTGLALFLAGEERPRGAHLENLVLCDLFAWRAGEIEAPEILCWRTAAGEEVDFVVEWHGRLLPIEVKSSERPKLADARGLRSFRADYAKSTLPGLLLHDGEEITWLADGILAVPWWKVV